LREREREREREGRRKERERERERVRERERERERARERRACSEGLNFDVAIMQLRDALRTMRRCPASPNSLDHPMRKWQDTSRGKVVRAHLA
jgi:hypothetical protein